MGRGTPGAGPVPRLVGHAGNPSVAGLGPREGPRLGAAVLQQPPRPPATTTLGSVPGPVPSHRGGRLWRLESQGKGQGSRTRSGGRVTVRLRRGVLGPGVTRPRTPPCSQDGGRAMDPGHGVRALPMSRYQASF